LLVSLFAVVTAHTLEAAGCTCMSSRCVQLSPFWQRRSSIRLELHAAVATPHHCSTSLLNVDSHKAAAAAAAVAAVAAAFLALLPLLSCCWTQCSWGPGLGDKGFFRVRFGVCGMLAPGDTLGLGFTPAQPRTLQVFGPVPDPAAPSGNSSRVCFTYKVRGAAAYRLCSGQ
jgi:hypothetical protein